MPILPYSSLFPIHSFAYNTHNGNIRSYNEDRISALPLPHNVAYFFAIYDGHGGCGCSSFLQSKLHHYLTSIANSKHIEHSILKCENDFISNHASDTFGNLSGSCALIAMITQDRKIIFVNIGDFVLCCSPQNTKFFLLLRSINKIPLVSKCELSKQVVAPT